MPFATFRTILLASMLFVAGHALALPLCGAGKRIDCVVDGDTLWIAGEKIRLADIDAPELSSPRCPGELALAARATARLAALTDGAATIARQGRDRYGRTLARVRYRGIDVGEELVREGLARPWEGRRAAWCGR